MLNIDRIAVLESAISVFGLRSQKDIAIEEMSELTKAICKERRARTKSERAEARANIIEEIADVYITLSQLIMIYDKDGECQSAVDYKVDRLEQTVLKALEEEI